MKPPSYRVFVSYSHEDAELAQEVVAHLTAIGMHPLYDQHLRPGDRFSDKIRSFIAYAHVFIPIVTPSSNSRPWVHQEIGYAIGLSVPLLPLAIGALPEGLSKELHALQLAPGLREVNNGLTRESIEHAATSGASTGNFVYHCAQNLNDRTRMLVDYAKEVREMGFYGMVRQKSAFSSFSLPDVRPAHRDWDIREDGHKKGHAERELLRDERQIMEAHARKAGCRLILDPEAVKSHGKESVIFRLKTLLQFLESMPDDGVEVVFARGEVDAGLIILGDWFVADAVVPLYGESYRKTVFTRHGNTVAGAVEVFDREFDELRKEVGSATRQAAIGTIEKLLERL